MDHWDHLVSLLESIKDAILHGPTPRDLDANRAAERDAHLKPFDRPNISPLTLTDAATSYQVFAENTLRKKIYLRAPLTNAGIVYVRLDGIDATASLLLSEPLRPGEWYSDDDPTTLTSIAALAATAGDELYAQEFNGR